MGNPPFIGKQMQSEGQNEDMRMMTEGISNASGLDYVTAWYLKAARYMEYSPATSAAFASTNSIAQGEQVGILRGELFGKHKVNIHFAHQTFKWKNEGRDEAAVFCIVVGFGKTGKPNKQIRHYRTVQDAAPYPVTVDNISPYLVAGPSVWVRSRKAPLCEVPEIVFGSMPNDGGHLLFNDEAKQAFLLFEPQSAPYIRPFVGAYEFINGQKRWCLWLACTTQEERDARPLLAQRVRPVQQHRSDSKRAATNKLSETPHLFGEIRQPNTRYLIIPRVSSERRKVIPMAFADTNQIAGDTCLCVPDADTAHFGILTSTMHMAWMRFVCGRLKSDYRCSNEVVYNNFPFPVLSQPQREAVTGAAQSVLDTRARHSRRSMASLYDPNIMPADLLAAHKALAAAVDACYRGAPFGDDGAERISFLFERYAVLVAEQEAEEAEEAETRHVEEEKAKYEAEELRLFTKEAAKETAKRDAKKHRLKRVPKSDAKNRP